VEVDRDAMKPIEDLAEFLDRLPGRFTDLLGMQVEQAAAERTVPTMECRRELTTPYGVMHGGAVAALADSAAGIAMMATLRPGEAFATVEMKMNLLGAVREGTLTAEASAIHRGRRTAVYSGQGHRWAGAAHRAVPLYADDPRTAGSPTGRRHVASPRVFLGHPGRGPGWRGVGSEAIDPSARTEQPSARRSQEMSSADVHSWT
jgi:uncharacterized protein (TIGR00369 family)